MVEVRRLWLLLLRERRLIATRACSVKTNHAANGNANIPKYQTPTSPRTEGSFSPCLIFGLFQLPVLAQLLQGIYTLYYINATRPIPYAAQAHGIITYSPNPHP